MPKPCMLNYDGTSSDISNTSFGGNAMMEWGRDGKKIWYKVVPDSDPTGASIYFADNQVDNDYHCWNFYDCNNIVRDHFYTAIYEGRIETFYVNNEYTVCARSLSRSLPSSGQNFNTEIQRARTNNTLGGLSGDRWYIETYGDRMLINWLLVLLGKSLDTQTVYGKGVNKQQFYTVDRGYMNNKGYFWGTNTSTSDSNIYGVKVFGMEHWWGDLWRRVVGYNIDRDGQYVKLTPNNADGSISTTYDSNIANMINTNTPFSFGTYYSKWFKYDSLGYSIIHQNYGNNYNSGDDKYYCDFTNSVRDPNIHVFCGGYRVPGSNTTDIKYAGAFSTAGYYNTNSQSMLGFSISFR